MYDERETRQQQVVEDTALSLKAPSSAVAPEKFWPIPGQLGCIK